MIAFGYVTTNESEFTVEAAGAIERMAEADSLLLRRHGDGPVAKPCNEIIDRAAKRRDLEALVLLAEDAQPQHHEFLAKIRQVLERGPEVALVGVTGACAAHPAGDLAGHLLVLAPPAVRELRFDETLDVPFDCAVIDVCHQARARGLPVAAGDFLVLRPGLCRKLGDRGRLVRGAVAVRRKWAVAVKPQRS